MKTPSPNTKAFSDYVAEMEAVLASIKALEAHGEEMTFYFAPESIPVAKRAKQAADESKLRDLGDNYTRLTDSFCAKYHYTEGERDQAFTNC